MLSPDPNAKSKPRMFLGLTMGLLAAAIGALYSVYATYGLAHGLKSADMTLLRTSVAGILTLPVLVYYLRVDAKVLTGQWRRWLAVALLAGPLFGELVFTAFQFAPPSHGAVFPFAAMSVGSRNDFRRGISLRTHSRHASCWVSA